MEFMINGDNPITVWGLRNGLAYLRTITHCIGIKIRIISNLYRYHHHQVYLFVVIYTLVFCAIDNSFDRVHADNNDIHTFKYVGSHLSGLIHVGEE